MLRVHAVSAPRNGSTIIDGAIAQLIEGVGDERFSTSLFKATHDSIGCIHIGAFAFDRHNRPALMFAENAGPSLVARQAGERYVKRYWKMDHRGIRFNSISPGPVDTPVFAKMGVPPEMLEGILEQMKATIPMRRFGEASELAKAILFLASSDSSFILGEEIAVDGGMTSVKA
jgi:hypothetical protein